MKEITIRQPDDWHIHLRDGEALKETATSVSRYFRRAIVMPNLVPPVTSVHHAEEYFQSIQDAVPSGRDFQALMTLYLTDNTSEEEIIQAAKSEHVYALKLYPAGATTNSDSGVTDITKIYPIFAAMEENGLPLLIHGEITDQHIDVFDREKLFIEQSLEPIKKSFPKLKIVFEHITTKDAVEYVNSCDDLMAATITAHHLLYNRNDMLSGRIKPHLFCLPILKRNIHQEALLDAATNGNPSFFLGTDSAPHTKENKENACGCAGIYSAPAAIELYAEVFDALGKLDALENFASCFGPQFYDLPLNEKTITLRKENWAMPSSFPLGDSKVVPIRADEEITWKVI